MLLGRSSTLDSSCICYNLHAPSSIYSYLRNKGGYQIPTAGRTLAGMQTCTNYYSNPCPGLTFPVEQMLTAEWQTAQGCRRPLLAYIFPWQCLGEVFRVYAHGKAVGEPLEDKDTIMLNYKAGGEQWFSLWKGTSHKDDCPGASLPHPQAAMRRVLEKCLKLIWKLDFVHIGK